MFDIFLSFFEIFTYQPLSYFELHTQIFPCIDHCGSALNDVLAVNLRLQAQKCAFQRTIGQNCKNPPKNQKKSWNWLCHTITATIKCNDRKRCESAEKFVKSHQGSLFLAGFSHLKPLWCARNLTKACVELMLEALLEKFTLLGPLPPSLNK